MFLLCLEMIIDQFIDRLFCLSGLDAEQSLSSALLVADVICRGSKTETGDANNY